MKRLVTWLAVAWVYPRLLWRWLRTFPRPWAVFIVEGDLISTGGTLTIPSGTTAIVKGSVYLRSEVGYAVTLQGNGCLEVTRDLITTQPNSLTGTMPPPVTSDIVRIALASVGCLPAR